MRQKCLCVFVSLKNKGACSLASCFVRLKSSSNVLHLMSKVTPVHNKNQGHVFFQNACL